MHKETHTLLLICGLEGLRLDMSENVKGDENNAIFKSRSAHTKRYGVDYKS